MQLHRSHAVGIECDHLLRLENVNFFVCRRWLVAERLYYQVKELWEEVTRLCNITED